MGGSIELKRVRRLTSRVAKSIMKSHHLRIPKYEMPLRFRPVITMIPLIYYLLILVAVVSRLYMLHNGHSCFPGVHKLFKIFTSQWQIVAFLMFLYCNCSILLHHRRRRVRLQTVYTASWYLLNLYILQQQECKTNMVLETFRINFHRIYMFLLRWYSKWICTSCFTSWVFTSFILLYSEGEA